MFQEIYNDIQAKMQQQIQEKFGLSADQTTQSTNVLLDNFKKFFSEDLMAGGMAGLKDIMSNGISDIKNNPTMQTLRENIVNDLVNKVGLAEETAQKVRDFSLTEVFDKLKTEFLDENGKPDFSKIMSKINMADFQGKAQEMMGKMGMDFGKLFGK
ncbi:MAG: hypothetical protein IT275_06095 [Chitinophagales bacterium]|nr:hypothetical protein [Chitinophagales bacterium]HMV15303.1 hypothetical protein [Chitinophagales bacterium]HMW12009.1 hypothetical protein [Chitinophagales bacterium]HMX59687.1 hypothetical protein [Chitinophagales bacterium]HMY23840.1 hypothetical protein [Chitinophagales bacterium]